MKSTFETICDHFQLTSADRAEIRRGLSVLNTSDDYHVSVAHLAATQAFLAAGRSMVTQAQAASLKQFKTEEAIVLNQVDLLHKSVKSATDLVHDANSNAEKVTDRAVAEVAKRSENITSNVIQKIEGVVSERIGGAASVIKKAGEQANKSISETGASVIDGISSEMSKHKVTLRAQSYMIYGIMLFVSCFVTFLFSINLANEDNRNRIVSEVSFVKQIKRADLDVINRLVQFNDLAFTFANECGKDSKFLAKDDSGRTACKFWIWLDGSQHADVKDDASARVESRPLVGDIPIWWVICSLVIGYFLGVAGRSKKQDD